MSAEEQPAGEGAPPEEQEEASAPPEGAAEAAEPERPASQAGGEAGGAEAGAGESAPAEGEARPPSVAAGDQEQPPAPEGGRPASAAAERPASQAAGERPASAAAERPASQAAERPASAAAERPASAAADRPASQAAERPASAAAERPASQAAERPASAAAERPASQQERPASAAAERPASQAERPASAAAERPASQADRPASQAERPASAAAERPASQTERPASQAERPSSQAERPASAAERPASQAASAAAERPASQADRPASAAAERPASQAEGAPAARPGSDFARTPSPEHRAEGGAPAAAVAAAAEGRPASQQRAEEGHGHAGSARGHAEPAAAPQPEEPPVAWKDAKEVPVPAAIAGHPPGRNLSILVHNVLANCWVTPDWQEGVDPALLDPARRRHIIMDRIAAYDADIVCLQELERGELQHILDRFRTEDRPLYFATSLAYNHPSPAGVEHGCAVLLRSRLFEPDFDVENQVWNEEGSAGNIVLCTRKVAGKLEFVRICLVNCRLARDEHGLKQAQRIVHRVRHFLRAKPADIVLWVGDFGCEADGEVVGEALDDGFRDAAAEGKAEEPTYAPADPSSGGGPFRSDLVLFKGAVAGLAVDVPRYGGGGGLQGRAEWSLREFGSDHAPIACRFTFEDTPWQPPAPAGRAAGAAPAGGPQMVGLIGIPVRTSG